jgi:hypothetical protein
MTTAHCSFISAIVFTCLFPVAHAEPFKCAKIQHALSPAESKRWVDAVKTHKTLDGATVMEVLKYVEQMRPKRFRLGTIEVGYNCGSGEPDAVMIGYFIGMKRLEGDEYSFGYDIKRNGKEIELIVPKNPVTEDTIINALEGGRDGRGLLLPSIPTLRHHSSDSQRMPRLPL